MMGSGKTKIPSGCRADRYHDSESARCGQNSRYAEYLCLSLLRLIRVSS
jgi:hypothetical protein